MLSTATTREPRYRRKVYKGVLSDIQIIREGGEIVELKGVLSTTTSKGVYLETNVSAIDDAIERVFDMFQEGPVAFYGEVYDGGFDVIGPDLRNKTLLKPASRVNPAPQPDATPHPVAESLYARMARERIAGHNRA